MYWQLHGSSITFSQFIFSSLILVLESFTWPGFLVLAAQYLCAVVMRWSLQFVEANVLLWCFSLPFSRYSQMRSRLCLISALLTDYSFVGEADNSPLRILTLLITRSWSLVRSHVDSYSIEQPISWSIYQSSFLLSIHGLNSVIRSFQIYIAIHILTVLSSDQLHGLAREQASEWQEWEIYEKIKLGKMSI